MILCQHCHRTAPFEASGDWLELRVLRDPEETTYLCPQCQRDEAAIKDVVYLPPESLAGAA